MVELGKKHECPECETKFYDLGRVQVVCPSCGIDLATGEAAETAGEPEPEPAQDEGELEDSESEEEELDDDELNEDLDDDESDDDESDDEDDD